MHTDISPLDGAVLRLIEVGGGGRGDLKEGVEAGSTVGHTPIDAGVWGVWLHGGKMFAHMINTRSTP